jgi:hypothetical protein
MVHRKLIIGPGLVATAALLAFSGIAGAQSPVAPATGLFAPWFVTPAAVVPDVAAAPVEPCDTQEATGTDTDNIREGDQTGPEVATDPAEASGPDTDNIQEGDQTGPDACATDAAASAGTVATLASAVKVQAPTSTVHHRVHRSHAAIKSAAASAEQGSESETSGESSGESSAESDGPGGHEDTGANADHQFEGEE